MTFRSYPIVILLLFYSLLFFKYFRVVCVEKILGNLIAVLIFSFYTLRFFFFNFFNNESK